MTPGRRRVRKTNARPPASGRSFDELSSRVTLECAAAVAVLAGISACLGGAAGAIGAAAGGGIGILSFRGVVRAGTTLCSGTGASASGAAFLAGFRYLASFGALAAVLMSGWAHPLAVMAGLTVLPASVIVRGLAAAREDVDQR